MFKTMLITFSASVSALALTASLFLNSILGLFGLTTTTVDSINNLRTSQQVLEKVKQRHAKKKTRVAKRLSKRSGKRVAATALAAATIGTVAVAVAMTSMEIADYCSEKKDLQEEANILHGTNEKFDTEQCVEESKDDAEALLTEAKAAVTSSVSDAFESTAHYSRELWASAKSATAHAYDSTSFALGKMWDRTQSWLTD